MQPRCTIIAPHLALALLAHAPAPAQHRDIHLYAQDAALRTGQIDLDDGGTLIPGVRAFAGVFGEVANGTNDPGFNASIGAFPPATILSFNILDALRRWDGSDFDTIPPERLFLSLGASNRQTPTTPGAFVSGFNITAAAANGSMHQHINFFLTSPSAPGVYLLTIELATSNLAQPSQPLYLVFRQGTDAPAQDAALAYVRNVLLAPPVCTGDATGDRAVTFADITAVLSNFGLAGSPGIPGDADRDGLVTFADITFVLTNWGNTCP